MIGHLATGECPRCRTVPPMDDACACAWRDRRIGRYKGLYAGRRVAILCGGTTAAEQDLDRITCPILGVNESWRAMPYPRTFAHLLSDWRGALAYGEHVVRTWPEMPVFQKVGNTNKLIEGAIELRARAGFGFHLDIEYGACTLGAPVLALQLVVYMGFTDVVFVGLDHKRRGPKWHWWDEHENPSDPRGDWAIQGRALREGAATLAKARPDVKVCNVSHDTACDAFELRRFDEVFA